MRPHSTPDLPSFNCQRPPSAPWAVVSAGRWNLFGHPHPDVIARYEAAGVGLLQTASDGAVALCTDGERVGVSTATGRRFTLPAS